MTPQQAKELLPVITAFANGEIVEFRLSDDDNWGDGFDLRFDFPGAQYRIKPVPHDDKWAMQQMKAGKKVRRRTWNTGMSVYLRNDLVRWNPDEFYTWVYPDSIATDWELAE